MRTVKKKVRAFIDSIYFNPDDKKWYFYDQTWAASYGPYRTKKKVRTAFKKYVKDFLGQL